MNSIKFIVTIMFLILLIWGPIFYSLEYWLIIRILYLVLIPTLSWFLLQWLWGIWKPSHRVEIKLERTLAFLTSLILFSLAIIEFMSDSHLGNTLWVRSIEGREAVGEDIILDGPNWATVIILLIGSGFSLWLGFVNKEKN
ncbi:MAG: hypothetical protein K9J16_08195 [Melioribacteraceae bacterium]|nr:hypothetical protein [Melioribacteraceae bacterium]MCF8353883.1 hypothetical protein [Melioribacteraceae bacterium]MCF8393116.1 hypothetical protein [Melioribacteraceae bacterium]MCF8419235.1 hypothetical protein [Melioribacteraceae bacterium]